jgi:hypothetical protein
VYSREYNQKIYTLEASGGLIHSSLVMQDRESDSYWSLMKGEIVGGELEGTIIEELPVGEKMMWKDWVAKYPQTLVLSVKGKEDAPSGYKSYYQSDKGYRGSSAEDVRLKTKEPVFTFKIDEKKYAVPFKDLENGVTYDIGSKKIFLFRPEGVDIFNSTKAFISAGMGFVQHDEKWVEIDSGCIFDTESGVFLDGKKGCPERMNGFDTFWYNWSLNNPDTELLGDT